MSEITDGSVADFGGDAELLKTTPIPTSDDNDNDKCEPVTKSNEDDLKRVRRTQWSLFGPGQFIGSGRTIELLLPGVYTITTHQGEPIFVRRTLPVDSLMEFPDSLSNGIITEIENFWTKSEVFKKYGFLHRRGYLMYGPAGSGKTSLVQQIIARIINHKGIVFLCDHPTLFLEGLSVFREVEPDRPVVCIFEDIDAIIAKYGEDKLLSVLDGENQIDKVLNIATTNYPGKLDKRIVSRPRRFDRVIRIGMPSDNMRRLYFSKKLGIESEELDKWVNNSKDFSFAAMSEMVISVKCLGNGFEETVKLLEKLLKTKFKVDDDFEKEMGRSGVV